MNKKIIKIILIGSIILNTPFLIGLYYTIKFVSINKLLFFAIPFCLLMLVFWSIFVPKYKFYSINKLNNAEEYKLWYEYSVNAFIICPKQSLFNKLEYWNKNKLNSYNNTLSNFTQ
jgi:hypothetical protein